MRYFGAAYYPELFPRHEWEADVARMAEAGMNVVRLAEAAWLYLEPDGGVSLSTGSTRRSPCFSAMGSPSSWALLPYTAVAALGLRMDGVSPLADLAPYAVVIVPALSLVRPDIAQNIARYVTDGGIVVLPPRTGRYTWDGTLPMELAPGSLADLCGIQVRDYDVLLNDRAVRLGGETAVPPAQSPCHRSRCGS